MLSKVKMCLPWPNQFRTTAIDILGWIWEMFSLRRARTIYQRSEASACTKPWQMLLVILLVYNLFACLIPTNGIINGAYHWIIWYFMFLVLLFWIWKLCRSIYHGNPNCLLTGRKSLTSASLSCSGIDISTALPSIAFLG